MFSYFQIARWLTFPIDPITVEDWVANREIFGPEKRDDGEKDRELEQAYLVEQIRSLGKSKEEMESAEAGGNLFLFLNGFEPKGIVDKNDFLVIAPSGSGEPGRKIAEVAVEKVGMGKAEKLVLEFGEVYIKELDPTLSVKLKAKFGGRLNINGKSQTDWSGAGKKKLVVDLRGRPIPDFGPGQKSQEMMRKMREAVT